MNSHLRPYNRCISNISTNIYLGLDFYLNKLLINDPHRNIEDLKKEIVKVKY